MYKEDPIEKITMLKFRRKIYNYYRTKHKDQVGERSLLSVRQRMTRRDCTLEIEVTQVLSYVKEGYERKGKYKVHNQFPWWSVMVKFGFRVLAIPEK